MKLKKLLSVILAAVMLLGCMSIPSFAADDDYCTACEGTGNDTKARELLAAMEGAVETIEEEYNKMEENGPSGLDAFENAVREQASIMDGAISNYDRQEWFNGNVVNGAYMVRGRADDILYGVGNVVIYDEENWDYREVTSYYEDMQYLLGDLRDAVNDAKCQPCEGIGEAFLIDDGVLIRYNGKGGNVVIPNGVTAIDERAFENCVNLTGVTIPSGVKSIGDYAFVNCNSLAEVTIPSGVESIGMSAFDCCVMLTEVTIPSSVTSIGNCAFGSCYGLTDVTLSWTDAADIPQKPQNIFINIVPDVTVHIPDGMTAAYAAKGWVEAPAPEDPSGVDLSVLTTGKKIMLGTKGSDPVEWVIGGDGTTGMSVPTGCIALVSNCHVPNNTAVRFDPNGESNVYSTSNLRNIVENAVTFTTDEQAVIQTRTLETDTYKASEPWCDGVAGDSVTAAVWAPTTKDAYALLNVNLCAVGTEGSSYWLCSPGSTGNNAAYTNNPGSEVFQAGTDTDGKRRVRVGLYLDLSKVYGATAVEGKTDTYTLDLTAPSTFLTSFTLSKDYDDKYSTGNKTTAVSETVTYTITAISTGDDVPELPDTFTIEVTDGVGSADVALPTITKAGDYWYEIKEISGNIAGVTYDTNSYYLHLVTDCKGGLFGVLSAQIHLTAPVDGVYVNEESDKIDTVSNEYGEGTLTVTQVATFNGEESDTAEFTETVTFTLPAGKEITGNVTYTDSEGNHTIEPKDWEDDGTYTVELTLKNGESVTFTGLPDGTTYAIEQTEADEAFPLESVEFDKDETGDTVTSNVANGTIGDPADTVTITNASYTPLDVGVILENGAFIILALGAVALAAWLVIAKRKNRESVDAE